MRILFSIILICFVWSATAQKTGREYIDSIRSGLNSAKEDSGKALMLYNLGVAYSASDLDTTLAYARAGLTLSQKIKWDKGIGAFYFLIGAVYTNKANYDSALIYHTRSYELDKRVGDDHGVVADLINIGLAQVSRGNYVKAMDHFTEAMPIAEQVKDTGYRSLLYSQLSNVYLFQKDYKQSKAFADKALLIASQAHQQPGMAQALTQLGTISHEQADTISAMQYYNKALGIYRLLQNNMGEASILSNIGILQKDKRTAIEFKLKAQELWDSLSPSYADAIKNTGNLGIDYLDLVRYDTLHLVKSGGIIPEGRTALLAVAEKYLRRAVSLSKEASNMEWYWLYAQDLGDLLELKGDYKQALEYNKLSSRIHDSLYSQENKNRIAAIAGERELAIRDKEIALNKLTLSAQRRQRIALIAGIALLLVIGGMLYRQSTVRKKNNNKLQLLNEELNEANKVKAKFFAILSHDLRSPVSNLISFLELQQEAPDMMDKKDAVMHQQNISTAARSLLDNMEAMLMWSKEQMENFKPEIRSVGAQQLFTYLDKFFADTKQVQFSFSDPNNLILQTDENYLQTIMLNLTANAVKALKDTTGASVHWVASRAGEQIMLTITDNGPGINALQVNALNNEATVANAKSGFGLHLVRDLAKAINCSVTVNSKPGEGTSFVLTLN